MSDDGQTDRARRHEHLKTPANRIRQLHWDIVPRDVAVPHMDSCPVVLALWPAPVNADTCFASAGFHDFADADDAWESDWRGVAGRALAGLEQIGTLVVRAEAEIYRDDHPTLTSILSWLLPDRLLLKRVYPPLAEQIGVVTTDDRFGEVLIEYGMPTKARLLAGGGHELLWIGWTMSEYAPERFVEEIAAGLRVVRTTLKWQVLVPIIRSTNRI